jgi:lactose/L-arabinose transport system ATP-binding protein
VAELELKNIRKKYGTTEVIHGLNLSVQNGEFFVVVGPSGCGKSTLLRIIAGLEELNEGEVRIGGKDSTKIDPAHRGVAMVFQTFALYPHMTVEENMGFGLKMAKHPKKEIKERVKRAAETLQLTDYLKRKPKQLSGGQRQRVAIGRAIVREPQLFLFDEPLSNLDIELRVQMRIELARLHRTLNATMLYVTHDQVEAMTLANRMILMSNGSIEQMGTPSDLYHLPSNLFVAGFIGTPRMNFFKVRTTKSDLNHVTIQSPDFQSGEITIPTKHGGNAQPNTELTLGLRPEHLTITENALGKGSFWTDVVESLGDTTYLHALTTSQNPVTISLKGFHTFQRSEPVPFDFDLKNAHLFDSDGNAL